MKSVVKLPFSRLAELDAAESPAAMPESPSSGVRVPGGMRPWVAMEDALAEAHAAAARGEVPVGAVVLDEAGVVIARAGNQVEAGHDAGAHAEMLALRQAARHRRSSRLEGCTLLVTLEPCPMCAAAAVHFRVARVVFGAYDPKGGGVEHGPGLFRRAGCLHRPDVIGGIREQENAALLKSFFRALRSDAAGAPHDMA